MSETPRERPLAFVIGDSISMGYGPFLEQYLAPFFRYASKRGGQQAMRALGLPVHGNGGDSSQVLKYLVSNHVHDEIPATDYLLINCGLHDIRTDPASGVRQIDEDSYRSNLEQIVVAARDLCDTFCWIRTTPCDEAVHNTRGMGMHRFAADGRAYNAIADSVMRRRGVPAVDLYAFTRALGPDLYADHVHFHPHIQARQAAFIAGWLCVKRRCRGSRGRPHDGSTMPPVAAILRVTPPNTSARAVPGQGYGPCLEHCSAPTMQPQAIRYPRGVERMSESQAHVPIRAITTGPSYHWFGYYDKLQFDPGSRYVLAMAVDFEHRAPRPGDEIRIGMIDLQDGDAWRPLGTTSAWCWQQGCMLQWIPGSASEVIWNERAGDRYVARITDTATGASRTVPAPVYALSPDGRTAVGPDFRRLNDMRPGYGYEGIPDPWADQLAPEESGIHTVDLDTGETRQIISVADAAAVPYPHGDLSQAKHYFNHLLFSPDGSRFIFLHRWRTPGVPGMRTRMFTAAADGSDLHVVDDYGGMSHFIWRDPETILAWSWQPSHEGAFYVYRDRTDRVEVIGKHAMTLNGHCTYLSDPDWILNDCYPREGTRTQELYLYHVPTATRVELGGFHAPEAYRDESRCDLHPRSDPSGRLVTIDSAHAGGRQIYLLDIAAATANTSGHAVRQRPAVSDLPSGNRTK